VRARGVRSSGERLGAGGGFGFQGEGRRGGFAHFAVSGEKGVEKSEIVSEKVEKSGTDGEKGERTQSNWAPCN